MNSKRLRVLALAACAGLGGCLLGPWNMAVHSAVPPVTLDVSCMLVADRPFDSLWLERPLALDQKYDSAETFVDTSATRIFVTRTDAPGDTVFYRMSADGDTRIWRPVQSDTVRTGAHYALHAVVRWNAAREFPADTAFQMDTLDADAYTQSHYALKHPVFAPIEALHPSLSTGLPPGTIQKALQDTGGYLITLYDSLSAFKSLAALNVSHADFLQYLKGYPVLRPVVDGDSVYFILDAAKVPDLQAGSILIQRFSRAWQFPQDYDPADFGGLVLVQGWDTTRARIESPIRKELTQSLGVSGDDSSGLYQPGNTVVTGIDPVSGVGASGAGVADYPDTVSISNLTFDYTGRNILYFYAVDSAYSEQYYRTAGAIPGLGGGGNAPVNNNLIVQTNVRGGSGYFAAAVVDSFSVQVMTLTPDTFSVAALHQLWLHRKKNDSGD